MESTWILAFVITPALVVMLGYAAVKFQEYELEKIRRTRGDK
jgi:hypothetical protein